MKNMKKILVASVLAAVIGGSGLLAVNLSDDIASAAYTESGVTQPDAAVTGNPPKKHPPQRDGACQSEKATGTAATRNAAASVSETVQGAYTVTIFGGFDTDPQDHGRPVALIAAALGVPTEVFREAFSGVTPAGLDRGPTDVEAERNKAALMEVLVSYGITNDRLDEVSNYYRYNSRNEKLWKHTLATAVPILADGKITGVTITSAGSGYSSAPTVTITGPEGTVTAKTTIAYSDDFSTNGRLSAITLE
jgi:hypothetical protein